ncbi:hypothetical protein J3R83DRAFT_13415 [Lanmaoa asiatica]|nr:hypothetical protein J3R83DRAFT_13415 [Lanmaoa asiatica]
MATQSTQISRLLHLLQDHQRFTPLLRLSDIHHDPSPQATYPASSSSRPGFRTYHTFSLKQTPTLARLRYAFLDIGPLSQGHALVIPKGNHTFEPVPQLTLTDETKTKTTDHTVKMHELPDEYLADALPIAKKIALAQGLENYNILQNNGRIAHQEVDHVHFHVIPKPNETEGIVFTPESWPAKKPSMDDLKAYYSGLLVKLEAVGKM